MDFKSSLQSYFLLNQVLTFCVHLPRAYGPFPDFSSCHWRPANNLSTTATKLNYPHVPKAAPGSARAHPET